MNISLRKPCVYCSSESGMVVEKNGQHTVRCDGCDSFQYNAPKTDLGLSRRSVQTTHEAISPKKRAKIINRANGFCEMCGASGVMHVGHVISVVDGHSHGMTDAEINSDENLICQCEECNLGTGGETLPVRLILKIIKIRCTQ